MPNSIVTSITNKANTYNAAIDKQTVKYLHKLQRQEKKLYRKLAKLDSTAAQQLFANSNTTYQSLTLQITNPKAVAANKLTQYIPQLDSTITALNYLGTFQPPLESGQGVKPRSEVQDSRSLAPLSYGKESQSRSQNGRLGVRLYTLQNKLQATTQVQQLVANRKAQLLQAAQRYNLAKSLKKYSKTAYYYNAKIEEYKLAIKDPVKAEKLLLAALHKIPAFQKYFQQYSIIGQLFPQPNSNAVANLAGLQTRAQVQQQIQALAAGSPGGMATITQSIQTAQNQLSQLKAKANSYTSNGGNIDDMPKGANEQKTKSLKQRLIYTANVQTSKGNNYLPNTAQLAVGIGYKLSNTKVVGVQTAYKLGLGNGLNKLQLSHQGFSIRNYADIKMGKKGGLWLTFEEDWNFGSSIHNTNRTNFNTSISTINSNPSPTPPLGVGGALGGGALCSSLLGLTKKYNLTSKRKGEIRILYNFLWKQQVGGQQIVYRTGITF